MFTVDEITPTDPRLPLTQGALEHRRPEAGTYRPRPEAGFQRGGPEAGYGRIRPEAGFGRHQPKCGQRLRREPQAVARH